MKPHITIYLFICFTLHKDNCRRDNIESAVRRKKQDSSHCLD